MKKLITLLTLTVAVNMGADMCLAAPSIEPGVDFELPWSDIASAELQTQSEVRRIASYMPSEMSSSDSFTEVAAQMIEGTTRNFSQSEEFNTTELGIQVERIQSVVTPSLSIFSFEGDDSHNETEDNDPYREAMPDNSDVNHELEVQLDAPGSRAKLRYSGVLDASAEYTVAGDFDISLKKSLDKSTSIRMVHHASTAESLLSLDVKF